MSKYIIKFFVQGEKYDEKVTYDDFDWCYVDTVKSRFKTEFLGDSYQFISGSRDGSSYYDVYYSEKKKKALCFSYFAYETTDFIDCNGANIVVGDTISLSLYFPIDDRYKYILRRYNNNYYLRPVDGGRDISIIDQERFNSTIICNHKFPVYD